MTKETWKHLYFHFSQLQNDVRNRWVPRGNDISARIEKKLKHDWLTATIEMERTLRKMNEMIESPIADWEEADETDPKVE